jgi:hypothetical protein
MQKYVTKNNKYAAIKVDLHKQQGYVDRKINIEYSSKYVETKEEYEPINIPNILTVGHRVFLYSTALTKKTRFYGETLNCLG